MNALDPRCQTALGRALCALLHAGKHPAPARTESHEFLRPARGPHNALECYLLAGSCVFIAALIANKTFSALPLGWRFPLALLAAPILLQIITLVGILLTRLLPAKLRPAAISQFLLGTLSIGALPLLPSPWMRYPAAVWLGLYFLNLACAAWERLAPSQDS